ncbi:MAG: hypothetical protein JWQ19_3655 [Subtercola sp.]|nr:hypothetical protein [Subtercola sp.]
MLANVTLAAKLAVAAASAVLCVAGLMGCAAAVPLAPTASVSQPPPPSTSSSAHRASSLELPPAGGVADYQLGGAYRPDAAVQIVTRDSTAQPAAGLYSICYVNAFQSQPGVKWPSDLLVRDSSGTPITDPGWPDEHLFDISTEANRARLLDGLQPSIRLCASSGFQAVEFDNLDSYTRSLGALTADDAVAFATALVSSAHPRGLAVAQKNAADLATLGATSIGFDFAMTEECFEFDECSALTAAYGAHVIDVEYTSDLTTPFADVCASASRAPSTMLRDRELTSAGAEGHVYEHC